MNRKKRSVLQAAAAVSISSLIYLNLVNSATLPYLAENYPQYSITVIKLFSTIPSLMMIFCSLVSGKLAMRFPIRKIVTVCCVVIAAAGTGTYFVTDFRIILLLRSVYGIGYGISFPLANVVIQQLFEGEQRIKLMGIRSAYGALFGAAVSMFGGWLTTFGWRNASWGYLFAIPVAFLVYFFCPENGTEMMAQRQQKVLPLKKRFTRRIWLVLIFATIVNICIISFSVELALIVKGEGIGEAGDISLVFSVNTLLSFVAGIFFFVISKKMKRFTVLLATGLIGTSFLAGCAAWNIPSFIVCAAVFGLGFGLFNPACNLLVADTAASPCYGGQAIAIYTSCMGMGQFLYPYLFEGIKCLLGLKAIRSEWMMAGCIIWLVNIIAFVYLGFVKRKEK